MNDELENKEEADELEVVPERNFWDRSFPVSLIPKSIAKYFFQVKEKFGLDIANLVLFIYKDQGKEVATAFANKVLEFNSFEQLMRFLEARTKRLGNGRELVNSLLFTYRYSYYFNEISAKLKNACSEAKDKAVEIFNTFVSYGYFYAPTCIIQIAEVESGCKNDVAKRCKSAFDTYIKLKEKIGEGSK